MFQSCKTESLDYLSFRWVTGIQVPVYRYTSLDTAQTSKTKAKVPTSQAAATSSSSVAMVAVGDEVIVEGLKGRPELNGKRGKVTESAQNGRFFVQLGSEVLALKLL